MKKKYLTAIITALVVISGFAVVYASSDDVIKVLVKRVLNI